MFSFTRLLELAGKPIILEALTPREAAAIFKFHGISDDVLDDPNALRTARSILMKKMHSDITGISDDKNTVGEINAAYDVLKANLGHNTFNTDSPRPSQSQSKTDPDAPWAWAGHSGGAGPSKSYNEHGGRYRDINYIKKRMWELSGKSRTEYTVMAYDGYFFRSQFTVYGNEEIFPEMCKAMAEWNGDQNYKTVGIFINLRREGNITLRWLDGKMLKNPVTFIRSTATDDDDYSQDYDFRNGPPYNDQQFMRKLPEYLTQIRAGHFKNPHF